MRLLDKLPHGVMTVVVADYVYVYFDEYRKPPTDAMNKVALYKDDALTCTLFDDAADKFLALMENVDE